MEVIALLHVLEHTGVGGAELGLVKVGAELLGSLGHLLVYLLVVLGDLVFYQIVGTIAFLAVAIVDERIVESVDMTRSLPHGGVHEDGCIDTHDIAVEQHHRFPPIFLYIVFQFHTVLTVVVNGCESVVDFRAGKDKAIFLTVAYYLLENVILCHNLSFISN